MGDLLDSFDRSLEGLPLLSMRRLVDEKLKAIGTVDDAVADRLANALMAQEDSDIDLHELGIGADLEFTSADVECIEKATAALFESMPELLQELAVEAGDAIAGDLGELENVLAGRDRFDNGENSAAGFHLR
ncbi:MAG: hypothetical protein PGN16_12565 [Sphingomonas phyllosphaerae]|uniref:hypothetical protein n=1 Tax=Sphingomonas phyllosphaerae TaxID=257003 RepID=UPI00261EA1D7|nr:hypothetical protein [uncultured Sphingomonas sp.]